MQFKFSRFEAGGFDAFEAIVAAGDTLPVVVPEEIAIDRQPSIFAITGGRFSFGPFAPDGSYHDMPCGFTSHNIAYRPAGERTIACVEDGTYLCLKPKGGVPYAFVRMDMADGQVVRIKKGSVLVAVKGRFILNGVSKAAPLIVVASTDQCEVVADGDFIGMEGWLK